MRQQPELENKKVNEVQTFVFQERLFKWVNKLGLGGKDAGAHTKELRGGYDWQRRRGKHLLNSLIKLFLITLTLQSVI